MAEGTNKPPDEIDRAFHDLTHQVESRMSNSGVWDEDFGETEEEEASVRAYIALYLLSELTHDIEQGIERDLTGADVIQQLGVLVDDKDAHPVTRRDAQELKGHLEWLCSHGKVHESTHFTAVKRVLGKLCGR